MFLSWFFITTVLSSADVSAPLPSWLEEEVARAVTRPASRIQIAKYAPSVSADCTAYKAIVPPISGSGQFAVRLFGQTKAGAPCDGWAWVRAHIFVRAWVTGQAIPQGAPIEGAIVSAEREWKAGSSLVLSVPEGSVASFPLGSNVALEEAHIKAKTPDLGQTITVRMVSGNIQVDQQARWTSCSKNSACALLPNGRRIEGHWNGERLIVENP